MVVLAFSLQYKVSEPRVFETRHHERQQEEAEEGEVNDCIQQQYKKRGHLLHVGQQAIHRLRTDIIQDETKSDIGDARGDIGGSTGFSFGTGESFSNAIFSDDDLGGV